MAVVYLVDGPGSQSSLMIQKKNSNDDDYDENLKELIQFQFDPLNAQALGSGGWGIIL